MLISTRGRYALRVLIDLAECNGNGYVAMKSVAERQGISLKYLERIIPALVKDGFIEGVQGKGGGYRLKKKPEEIRVGDILRLTEGNLAPVTCLECGAKPCEKSGECRTYPIWKEFHQVINEYFDGITIASIMKTDV